MRLHSDVIAMESIANLIISFFKFTYPITKEQIAKMVNQTGGIIIEDSKNNHFYPVTNILNSDKNNFRYSITVSANDENIIYNILYGFVDVFIFQVEPYVPHSNAYNIKDFCIRQCVIKVLIPDFILDEVVEKHSKIEDIANYFNANPAFIRELLENSNSYYVVNAT